MKASGGRIPVAAAAAITLAFALGVATPFQSDRAPVRTKQLINSGWSFRLLDSGSVASPVDLPHTWNADVASGEVAADESANEGGTGVYRRNITVPSTAQDRRYFLYFEGVSQVAEVYVNGEPAGQHVGGYTAFSMDITELVWSGDDNEVEVVVDNSPDPDVPPLSTEFVRYGGIYRDVWLISTSDVHIDLLDYASPGIFVSTPLVTESTARVEVRAQLRNDAAVGRAVSVALQVGNRSELVVHRDTVALVTSPHSLQTAQFEFELADVELWSPESPSLYRARVHVLDESGSLLDTTSVAFGVRSVLVDGDGFYLNGKPYQLIGTNRHQDFQGLGSAMPNALHRSDVELVKDTGFNFLRLAHYPQDPVVLETADQVGLTVWEEVPIVNTVAATEAFAANAENMLVEMIRQHYNHPSVIIWGIMNEPLGHVPDPEPPGYRDRVRELAERLHRTAHREDPHRPTALAVSRQETFDESGVADVTDVLGLSLYFGWKYGTGSGTGLASGLGSFLDSLHAARPRRPLFVSGYGAGSDDRIHAVAPRIFDSSAEGALEVHRGSLPQLLERSYLAGAAVWNMFDYGSVDNLATEWGISHLGLYSFDRRPKDVSRYYRAMLKSGRQISFAADRATRWVESSGERIQHVDVFTNAESVRLGATEADVSNGLARLPVDLQPGQNTLIATGEWASGVDSVSTTIAYHEAADCATACTYAINIGAHYSFVGSGGIVYTADSGHTSDSLSGRLRRVHDHIIGTDDDPVFQSFREWDAETVGTLAVPVRHPGDYQLTLGFSDVDNDEAGARVFSVDVDGDGDLETAEAEIGPLDLVEIAGRWGAVEQTVAVRVSTGTEHITLQLRPVSGSAVLSSVRLEKQ